MQAIADLTPDELSMPTSDARLVENGQGVQVKQYQLPLGMLPGDSAYIDALRDI